MFDNRKQIINYNDNFVIDNDFTAKPIISWWSNIWQTNFGWKSIVIVCPFDIGQDYKILFANSSNYLDLKICDLLINGYVGLLLGRYSTKFFAVNSLGEQIPLRRVARITKKEFKKLYKNTKLI